METQLQSHSFIQRPTLNRQQLQNEKAAFWHNPLPATEEASLCNSRAKIKAWQEHKLKAAARSAACTERASRDLSYLHPAHPELSQGSTHLGRRRVQVFPAGDDFDQQGVVMWRDDGALEGRGAVQTDPHALTTAEDLMGNRASWLRQAAFASKEKLQIVPLLLLLFRKICCEKFNLIKNILCTTWYPLKRMFKIHVSLKPRMFN